MAETENIDVTKVIEGFETAEETPATAEPRPAEKPKDYVPAYVIQAQERAHEKELRRLEETIKGLEGKIGELTPRKPRESEIEKMLAAEREKWRQEELKPLQERIQETNRRRVQTDLERTLLKHGARPEVMTRLGEKPPLLVAQLEDVFQDSEDFGLIAHENGRPVVSLKGNESRPFADMDEYVEKLSRSKEWQWAFKPQNMVGSPNYAGGGPSQDNGQPAKRVTRSELAADPIKMAAYMEAERQAGRNPRESFSKLPRE